jgi:hypothetical protein
MAGKLIKKESQIFLIYKEIQKGAVAKSYMRKGFLIHILNEDMRKYLTLYSMRRPLVIKTLQLLHSEFPYI